MTEKTKRKIEALAKKKYSYMVGSLEDQLRRDGDKVHYMMGATPFAEWCEKFERKLIQAKNEIDDISDCKKHRELARVDYDGFLEGFRQWQEER